MLKGRMSDEQFSLLKELINRQSCDSLKYLCNDIELKPFQTLLTAWILILRKFICTLDTGLGKTVIASACIKWLFNSGETKKFLYIVENGGMAQTARKVAGYTGLRVKTCNASEAQGYQLQHSPEDFDILMISYQALQSYWVTYFLVENKDYYQTVIFDECQWVSELNDSNTWHIVRTMREYYRDVIMFSATPFKTNPLQLLKQVELLDKDIIGNINEYIKDKVTRSVMWEITDWHGLDKIKQDLTLYVNGFTREELGIEVTYNPYAHVIQGTVEQMDIVAQEMHRIKSGSVKALAEVMNIVNDGAMDFKQGIIYCSTNENKAELLKHLRDNGIPCGIIDGTISKKSEREETIRKYLTGEYIVLVLNITTTLDLPSNYCIFYELCDAGTTNQFIGRGIRGFGDDELDVHFIITADTYEVDYFFNSVYRKSKYLQQVLGKDGKLMDAIRKQVVAEI